MSRSRKNRLALAALALVLVISLLWLHIRKSSAPTVAYRITDLGIVPGATSSRGSAINGQGQVTGYLFFYQTQSQFDLRAFLWANGVMTDLGALPGLPNTSGLGLNNHGQVVGYAEKNGPSSGQPCSAFAIQHGKMTRMPTLPGYPESAAYAVNDSGQIVGVVYPKGSRRGHGFLYSHGVLTDLGLLPKFNSLDASSVAVAINPHGDVVGTGTDFTGSDVSSHAFLYRNGKMTDLGALPDYKNSFAKAINASGQITGYVEQTGSDDGTIRAFLWQNGVMEELGTLPGYRDSYGLAINSRGQIVGGAQSLPLFQRILHDNLPFRGANGVVWDIEPHAFLCQNDKMTDLNALIPSDSGWVLNVATGINDKGQIVGTGVHHGLRRAFVLTPIGMK